MFGFCVPLSLIVGMSRPSVRCLFTFLLSGIPELFVFYSYFQGPKGKDQGTPELLERNGEKSTNTLTDDMRNSSRGK